jgi:hypothetical protein
MSRALVVAVTAPALVGLAASQTVLALLHMSLVGRVGLGVAYLAAASCFAYATALEIARTLAASRATREIRLVRSHD